jgi:cysteine synthase A
MQPQGEDFGEMEPEEEEFGAMRLARQLGPGHTIVTILCDSGTRYQSKLFNAVFLREKGLPVPDWL